MPGQARYANNGILNHKNAFKLLISLKMAYSWSFNNGEHV